MDTLICQKIIEKYIKAYNSFDIDKMLTDMDDNVRFENISDGEVNLVTNNISELRIQAEQARQFFKEREQTITNYIFSDNLVEVHIDYKGILAIDFPNGLKAGDKIELKGKSVFKFKNNKIIELKDIS
ncbi:MAG TPA: nuclear transport factor 2 family protein [Bacteroidales bacterium]|nr:nuclear transport factor 2 family protein [Bacteroidales bacterium]